MIKKKKKTNKTKFIWLNLHQISLIIKYQIYINKYSIK